MAVRSLALVLAACAALALLLAPAAAQTTGVSGVAFCDQCGDGAYTPAHGDYYFVHNTYSFDCTVFRNDGTQISFSGSGSSDEEGVFSVSLLQAEANAETAAGASAQPGDQTLCSTTTSSTVDSCGVLKLADGECPPGFQPGNGQTATATVGADGSIQITSTELCFSPPTPPSTCPPTTGGDPHFVGGDGSRFDFAGEPNENFCLLSDAHLHINAFYGGRYGEYNGNPQKALNWVRKVGILWGHHTVALAVREGARWQYDEGYMGKIEVDGVEVILSQPGDVSRHVDDQIAIKWVAAKEQSADDLIDVYEVTIGNVMKLVLKLRPEVEVMRTAEDGVVHFDLEWTDAQVSDHAHGVIGQTFRKDFRGRLANQKTEFSDLLHAKVVVGDNAEGFLDGSMADYKTTGLLKADCKYSRFARSTTTDLETSRAKELASGQTISTYITRKTLNGPVAVQ